MARALTDRALELLALLPPVLAKQDQFQASAAAQAEQLDNLDAALDQLAALVVPKTSGEYLRLWERMVGVTPDPDGTDEERLAIVLAWLSQMTASGSGADWVGIGTRLVGTGWTYQTHKSGGVAPVRNIYVYLSSAQQGLTYAMAQRLFEAISPANQLVTVFGGTGMLLDAGTLDFDPLG